MTAIQGFEDTVMERAESMDNVAYDDKRNDPSEFFIPQEDLKQLKAIANKIKNDYSKSRTWDTSSYMYDGGLYIKV